MQHESDDVKTRALQCARGDYQTGLITGRYSWSGSGIRECARLREYGLVVENGVLKNA